MSPNIARRLPEIVGGLAAVGLAIGSLLTATHLPSRDEAPLPTPSPCPTTMGAYECAVQQAGDELKKWRR